MSGKIYDVAIIGAGPAGSMLARFLEGQSHKTVLLDSRDFARNKKSCGGLIAPDAQKFLEIHGIRLPENIKVKPQLQQVKTIDLKTGLTRYYKRNYINIDRLAFERFLHKDLTCDKHFKYAVKSIEKTKSGFIINREIKAKIIVGADGASSKIRRLFFTEKQERGYVAVQEFFKAKETPFYGCYFDESLTDYYGWALVKNGIKQVGLAIPEDKNAAETFQKFKKKIGMRNIKSIGKDGARILRPGFFHEVKCTKNIFLIGEAGGYVSPSSAEGLSYAFKSAKALADSDFNEKIFRRKMRGMQINLFYKNMKSLLIYTKPLRHIVMLLTPKKRSKTP